MHNQLANDPKPAGHPSLFPHRPHSLPERLQQVVEARLWPDISVISDIFFLYEICI